jgi:hypothetical protein
MANSRELAAVAQAARSVEAAQDRLEIAIRRASAKGASLRTIAEHAGVSY